MTRIIKSSLVLLLMFPFLLFAQQVTVSPSVQVHLPQGYMFEAHSGSVSCALNLIYGHPASYVVRSNRTDLFLSRTDDIKRCLSLLLKEQSKPKHKQVSYPLMQTPITFPQYYGEVGQITCTKIHNGNGVPLLYEFFFPYLEKQDIPSMTNKEVLQSCLDVMVPNQESTPPCKMQKDFQKES